MSFCSVITIERLAAKTNLKQKDSKIVLQALAARHMPQMAEIIDVSGTDNGFTQAAAVHQSNTLLKLQGSVDGEQLPLASIYGAAGVFELRTYRCPTRWQLIELQARLSGSDSTVFITAGVNPLFYSEAYSNKPHPSVTYLIPFNDLTARRQAWGKVGADPEWKALQQAGNVTEISLYRRIEFSPPN